MGVLSFLMNHITLNVSQETNHSIYTRIATGVSGASPWQYELHFTITKTHT